MTTASILIGSVCAGVTLMIFLLGVLAWGEFSRLQRRTHDLALSGYGDQPFGTDSDIGRIANRFVQDMHTVATAGAAHLFDVNARMAPLRNRVAAKTGVVRALVGVLILGGLLVTLFNLQKSVQTLGDAFRTLSQQQASDLNSMNGSVSAIQRSMAGIAESARLAFQFSGIIILLAALGLLLSIALQRHAVLTVNVVTDWANRAFFEVWRLNRPIDDGSRLQSLNSTIEHMGAVVVGLEDLGKSMKSVGDLGSKLEESTALISETITRLPEAVKSSVGELSAQVASDISADLQHQTQNITRILAIYGEQEVRMRAIFDALKACEDHVQTSALALSALPGKIEQLSQSISGVTLTESTLERAVFQLDKKVTALPLLDIQAVAHGVTSGVATLDELSQRLKALATDTESLFRDWRRTLEAMAPAVAEETGRRIEPLLGELKHAVNNTDLSKAQDSLSLLLKRSETISGALERTADVGGLIVRMEQMLKNIQETVDEPLWKRFTRKDHAASA